MTEGGGNEAARIRSGGGRIHELDNWNLNSETALVSALNGWLSLKASYTIRYENDPVDDPQKADTILAMALVANL